MHSHLNADSNDSCLLSKVFEFLRNHCIALHFNCNVLTINITAVTAVFWGIFLYKVCSIVFQSKGIIFIFQLQCVSDRIALLFLQQWQRFSEVFFMQRVCSSIALYSIPIALYSKCNAFQMECIHIAILAAVTAVFWGIFCRKSATELHCITFQ